MGQESGNRPCKICRRPVVIVQNHAGRIGGLAYYKGIGHKFEAVHEGEEGGRPVVEVKPVRYTQLKVRLHEKCEARRERAAAAAAENGMLRGGGQHGSRHG